MLSKTYDPEWHGSVDYAVLILVLMEYALEDIKENALFIRMYRKS